VRKKAAIVVFYKRKLRTSGFRSWFDTLTTNEINKLPFVLSLSKDFIGASKR